MSGKRKTLEDQAHEYSVRAVNQAVETDGSRMRQREIARGWLKGYRASQRSARAAGKTKGKK